MNGEGLLRAAEARSQEMVQQAEEHSQAVVRRAEEQNERLKTDADTYVAETLRNLKDHLASIEMDVSRTILSIEKGLESLELPDSGEEEGDNENAEALDIIYEYSEDFDGSSTPGNPNPVPRRASLA